MLKLTQLVHVELEMKSRQLMVKPASSAMRLGWHTVGIQ